jgi:hypothetical protein
MNNWSRKLFFSGIAIIVLGPFIMFGVDYGLAKNQKPPIFAGKTDINQDESMTFYKGIGYEVFDYHMLSGRNDVVFKSKFLNVGEVEKEKE